MNSSKSPPARGVSTILHSAFRILHSALGLPSPDCPSEAPPHPVQSIAELVERKRSAEARERDELRKLCTQSSRSALVAGLMDGRYARDLERSPRRPTSASPRSMGIDSSLELHQDGDILTISVKISPLRCNLMKRVSKSGATSERLTITLGAGQREKIESIANERRTSAATIIRWALDDYIEAISVGGRGRSKQGVSLDRKQKQT